MTWRSRICRFGVICLIALGCVGAGPAADAAGGGARSGILWGVAESGLELGHGTKAGTNYLVPDPGYYLHSHVRLIRLPFKMSRMQPQAQAPLDPAFVRAVESIVARDQDHGAITLLDPHGYGFYDIDGKPSDILKDPAAAADYVDLMARIAATFAHDDVAIGLMNEPHTGSDEAYAPIWNRAIAAIRAAGFARTILVPHAHWSSAADISPATPYKGRIVDPLRNWVLEVHLYLDPDGTGTYRQPVANAEVGRARLSGAIDWSRQSGIKLFLGETGAPPDSVGLAALHGVLNEVAASPHVFWGIALWGAGGWWKPSYPMRLDPVDGVARPQFIALRDTFIPELLYLAKPAEEPSARVAIYVDGRQAGPDTDITADVSGPPQACPIDTPLRPGPHHIDIRPVVASHHTKAFVLASTWHGVSDSGDAFGVIGARGYSFAVAVPSSAGH